VNVKISRTRRVSWSGVGFGIKCDWACGKNYICSVPLKDRKGAEKFDVVFRCAVSDQVITKTVVRGCGKKSRMHAQAYVAAHAENGHLDATGFNIEDIKKCVEPVSHAKAVQKFQDSPKCSRHINGKNIRLILDESA
jgi:hypothetical protein